MYFQTILHGCKPSYKYKNLKNRPTSQNQVENQLFCTNLPECISWWNKTQFNQSYYKIHSANIMIYLETLLTRVWKLNLWINGEDTLQAEIM